MHRPAVYMSQEKLRGSRIEYLALQHKKYNNRENRCGQEKEDVAVKLTMLGTGNALVTECYNTCFALSDDRNHFLVDGGGGNGILKQLKAAGIDWRDIHDIFVTHKHMDHILGVMWVIRVIAQALKRGEYEGEVRIYGHKKVLCILDDMSHMLLSKKETEFIGKRIIFVPVSDGDVYEIIGDKTTFFNIHSTKTKQHGFTMYLDRKVKLSCCGDEPYNETERMYVQGSKWLLHEAFCLESGAERYAPYEKHHSTVKDACTAAEQLHVDNLVLYHTEDSDIRSRKARYTAEGKKYYSGNLYVPDDLETIDIS